MSAIALARELLDRPVMGEPRTSLPPADGVRLLREAEQLRARGRIREAIDGFRGAAARFQSEGRRAHASAALSTAFRLATAPPHADHSRTATIATDLAELHRKHGLCAEAAEVISRSLELLVPSGHLGLAMNVANWAVDAANDDRRFDALKKYALSRVGIAGFTPLPVAL